MKASTFCLSFLIFMALNCWSMSLSSIRRKTIRMRARIFWTLKNQILFKDFLLFLVSVWGIISWESWSIYVLFLPKHQRSLQRYVVMSSKPWRPTSPTAKAWKDIGRDWRRRIRPFSISWRIPISWRYCLKSRASSRDANNSKKRKAQRRNTRIRRLSNTSWITFQSQLDQKHKYIIIIKMIK